MSQFSLKTFGSHRFYKAKAMKPNSEIVNDNDNIFVQEPQTSRPEVEELVNVAEVAEEVMHSETELTNLQTIPITSAGLKATKMPFYYRIQSNFIRPAEVRILRRKVVQAIERPAHKTKTASRPAKPQTTPTETPAAPTITPVATNDAPRELHDGDKVQLRPHRSVASIANPLTTDTAQTMSKKTRHKHSLQLLRRLRRFSKRTRTKVDSIVCQMRHRPTRAELINAESRLGSTIFGPIPAGHRREFFHDQQNIWIWHEDWRDEQHQEHELTIRYEVRPSGVYKKLSAGHYVPLAGQELENFRQATHVYLYLIKQRLYRFAA